MVDMPKLKPEFKKQWLEALRSDAYTQGKGQLRCGQKYCCLGVAVAITDAPTDEREEMLTGYTIPTVSFAAQWYTDDTFMHMSRLSHMLQNPYVMVPSEADPNKLMRVDLAKLNDSGKYTFEELADLIEAQL